MVGSISTLYLMTLPYGLIVASVLIGKHTDKIENDRPVGVYARCLCLLGEHNALLLNKITFIAFLRANRTVSGCPCRRPVDLGDVPCTARVYSRCGRVYSQPKPTTKPDNWPVWPLWFVGWAMGLNRRYGSLFILGLILSLIVPPLAHAIGHRLNRVPERTDLILIDRYPHHTHSVWWGWDRKSTSISIRPWSFAAWVFRSRCAH